MKIPARAKPTYWPVLSLEPREGDEWLLGGEVPPLDLERGGGEMGGDCGGAKGGRFGAEPVGGGGGGGLTGEGGEVEGKGGGVIGIGVGTGV